MTTAAVSSRPGLAQVEQELLARWPETRMDPTLDRVAMLLELLRQHDVPITGQRFCVIGCGLTVGRPLGLILTRPTEHATVTLCHVATVDIAAHARASDVIVAAAGVAHLVKPDWVRPGATVLSVGITRTIEGILGDVHPEVETVAGKVSGATGGVGPMTRAMLLTNIVEIAERSLLGFEPA